MTRPTDELVRVSDADLPAHAFGRSAKRRAEEAGTRTEYLAFRLGTESFAVDIAAIVEILKPLPITEVPRAGEEIVGVMSVRGRLVTVLDLKHRFHLPRSFTMDRRTRILLSDAGGEQVGLLVDEVQSVHRLSDSEIEPPDVLGTEQPPHVVGIGRPSTGEVLLLVDLTPILSEE